MGEEKSLVEPSLEGTAGGMSPGVREWLASFPIELEKVMDQLDQTGFKKKKQLLIQISCNIDDFTDSIRDNLDAIFDGNDVKRQMIYLISNLSIILGLLFAALLIDKDTYPLLQKVKQMEEKAEQWVCDQLTSNPLFINGRERNDIHG